MCSSERIPLAKSLLQIFRHEKQEKVILKTMNDFEINKEGMMYYITYYQMLVMLLAIILHKFQNIYIVFSFLFC
jgi:hypothetical protein